MKIIDPHMRELIRDMGSVIDDGEKMTNVIAACCVIIQHCLDESPESERKFIIVKLQNILDEWGKEGGN